MAEIRRETKKYSRPFCCSAGRARGVGDGKLETHHLGAQLVDEGRLPGTGRSRDDVDVRHSTFCTCSRDFSISDFMMRPISVIFSASPAKPRSSRQRVGLAIHLLQQEVELLADLALLVEAEEVLDVFAGDSSS
jgi:hypothetical protein